MDEIFNGGYRNKLIQYIRSSPISPEGTKSKHELLLEIISEVHNLKILESTLDSMKRIDYNYCSELIQQLTKVSYRTFLSVFSEIFVVTFLKKNICSDIEVQVKNNGKVPDLMLNTSDMRIFGDVKALIQDPATFPEGPVLNYSSSVMSHK